MKQKQEVTVNPIQLGLMNVSIKGISPLLMHKFSDKNKEAMLDKQQGKSKEKTNRDIKAEVEDSIYKTASGQVCFPSIAFWKAMIESAPYLQGMDKKLVKGAVKIIEPMAILKFKKKSVNEAICRLSSGVRMIRFRPQFDSWTTEFTIKYNASQINAGQIINLIKLAGFHIGVGDWRPQCSGAYGQFTIGDKHGSRNGGAI